MAEQLKAIIWHCLVGTGQGKKAEHRGNRFPTLLCYRDDVREMNNTEFFKDNYFEISLILRQRDQHNFVSVGSLPNCLVHQGLGQELKPSVPHRYKELSHWRYPPCPLGPPMEGSWNQQLQWSIKPTLRCGVLVSPQLHQMPALQYNFEFM